MAYDPIQEDCLRLILGAMEREGIYPIENPPFIESCIASYTADPENLIKTDRDRSFHLVTLATETIDYRLPFERDDEAAERESAHARAQLREALDLDPDNWDARRMLAALDAKSADAYVRYLIDHRDAVRDACDALRAAAKTPYDEEFVSSFGNRPYIRWLAAIAAQALVTGQYRLALSSAEECLEIAPDDPAEVRLTAMLAMAKLECTREQLRTFHREHAAAYRTLRAKMRRHYKTEQTRDAWELIAEIAIAYHELDFTGATHALRTLMQTYPHAAGPLYYQVEFPEGVFGRANVEPGSEDELVLALSEATPLLQEGIGAPDNACLAAWIGTHELVRGELKHEGVPKAAKHGAGSGSER